MNYKQYLGKKVYIRLEKITYENYRNFSNASFIIDDVNPNNLVEFVQRNKYYHVMGLYGDNNCGKSTFFDGLQLVKTIISGESLPKSVINDIKDYNDFFRIGSDFIMLYENAVVYVHYSFKVSKFTIDGKDAPFIEEEVISINVEGLNAPSKVKNEKFRYRIIRNKSGDISNSFLNDEKPIKIDETNNNYEEDKKIFNDSFSSAFYGPTRYSVMRLIDARNEHFSFFIAERLVAYSKLTMFVKSDKDFYKNEMILNKNYLSKIFESDNVEEYEEIVLANLFTIYDKFKVTPSLYYKITNTLRICNTIIKVILPKTEVIVKDFSTVNDRIMGLKTIQLYSYRKNREVPLKNESLGRKKLFGTLSNYFNFFNNVSSLLVIDDIDDGIYEYILSFMFKSFYNTTCGQFICTAHDLTWFDVVKLKHLYYLEPGEYGSTIEHIK